MKTMLFWLKKGDRKARMVGLATAECSTLTVYDFSRMAERELGRFFIVDGKNAADGRRIIEGWRAGESVCGVVSVVIGGKDPSDRKGARIVALGANAMLAIAGASESARNWDARIARHGIVPLSETKALTGHTLDRLNIDDAFGKGLK